jgi:flagellar basal-body rod modification protein FlgD
MRSMTADDFMTLLITQLRSQDPFEPMTNEQMLSQVATIEQMQSSVSLTKTLENLGSQQEFGAASALIGRDVQGTVTDDTGAQVPVRGVVVAATFGSGGLIMLQLDNGAMLPMDAITAIGGTGQNSDATGEQTGALGNGDITGDGVVDDQDLAAMAEAYSGPGQATSEPKADLDADGDVDGDDFAMLMRQISAASMGDLNRDGTVDEADLAAMVEAYAGTGADNARADLDGDGDVDGDDLKVLLESISAAA